MTRRIETRARLVAAYRRALVGGALLGALACQSQATPEVHGEPPSAQTTTAAPAGASAVGASRKPAEAPHAQVGLAHYEEANTASAHIAPAPQPSSAAASPLADAAKAAAGETVQGAVVTEEPFSIWLQAVSPVSVGAPAAVEAVLVAKPPYHCNAEYPHKFKLGAAPPGLTYPEATVKGMQVTAERSVLRIPVQAHGPGKATVSGTLSFSVCTEERCLVEKRDLALTLEVK